MGRGIWRKSVRVRDCERLTSLRGDTCEERGFHWELLWSDNIPKVVHRAHDQLGRVRPHASEEALVGARRKAEPWFDGFVEAAVTSGPVGVLAHQADPTRDEELQRPRPVHRERASNEERPTGRARVEVRRWVRILSEDPKPKVLYYIISAKAVTGGPPSPFFEVQVVLCITIIVSVSNFKEWFAY